VFGTTCMLLCGFPALHLRAADRGCEVGTRSSLRPLGQEGGAKLKRQIKARANPVARTTGCALRAANARGYHLATINLVRGKQAMTRFQIGAPLGLVVMVAASSSIHAQDFKAACEALSTGVSAAGHVTEATFIPAGPVALLPPAPAGATTPAPDHCLIRGKLNERTGIDGKPYAIGYEVRIPASWNGKFIFQGGGGVDGVLRLALGVIGSGTPQPNGLSAGYASASTDAGHLEEPGPIGPYLFGLDPQARADKGYSSIPPVATAAKALITKVQGRAPARSYFVGCSNGGRQSMVATQRYPDMFDGVIAAAPAYRVPRAAGRDRRDRPDPGVDVDCTKGR